MRNLKATATNFSSIEVTWNIPVCPNGIISEFRLYCGLIATVKTESINNYMMTSIPPTVTTWTVNGLQPFKYYTFFISAVVGINHGIIDIVVLERTLSAAADSPPTLSSGVTTSHPRTRTRVPCLIADPRQINTGRVM